MKLTTDDIKKLINWVDKGGRSIDIDIKKHTGSELEFKIFAYDFELTSGIHINKISELPTKKSLRTKKIERLESELAAEKRRVK